MARTDRDTVIVDINPFFLRGRVGTFRNDRLPVERITSMLVKKRMIRPVMVVVGVVHSCERSWPRAWLHNNRLEIMVVNVHGPVVVVVHHWYGHWFDYLLNNWNWSEYTLNNWGHHRLVRYQRRALENKWWSLEDKWITRDH